MGRVSTRETRQTEIGQETQCAKCKDFWPADPEFFYFSGGRPHSWCKDCYVNDPKMIAKKERWLANQTTKRREDNEAQHA